MWRPTYPLIRRAAALAIRHMGYAMVMLAATRTVIAQDTPLISGGVGFFTNTSGGNTTYLPVVEPLIAAPIGPHVLVESRAALLEDFFPTGGEHGGYDHSHFVGLTYLQADFIATHHLTIVAGQYLIPFNTYNERLTPLWIGNFQDSPLNFSLGTLSTGSGLGGMLRGNAVARKKYTIDYAGFFSVRSGHEQFNDQRGAGGRVALYLPDNHLEFGLSYDRLLQGVQENFYGAHAWWEPKDTGFRLRSEFARGHHAQGYWIEADYRMKAFGGYESVLGRLEPVFRMQQTFRRDNVFSDGLPPANTQRTDFGLDYNLPHNTRILTSYARQFSSTGDRNVWETGIVYRFLFPAWKGNQ